MQTIVKCSPNYTKMRCFLRINEGADQLDIYAMGVFICWHKGI